jgi:lycopene elongase/hydratase (dihydrobisanhydrobacterioruberin-forming)
MSLNENLSLAFKVSRFRFWFYLTGPFTVGCIYGASRYLDLLNIWFFVYLVYFLVPANIFLYGVNDFWDIETDLLNPKKEDKEYRVQVGEKNRLGQILKTIAGLSLLLLPFMKNNGERAIFLLFLFLSYFYSAKPLRFKERPVLDSTSNLLYILPGVLAYYWVTGTLPPTLILLAGGLHSFAMHLFSAIPDIEFDRNTGINTSAVLFGRTFSLIICLIAWSVFAGIVILVGGSSVFRFLPLIYPIMVLNVLLRELQVNEVYWYYPYINVGYGGLLFLLKAIQTPWA